MYARTTTYQARPEMVEPGITYVRDAAIPMVEQIPGCIGQSMLVDRELGRCIVTAAWQSHRLMDASTQRVQPMRDQATEILGASLVHEEWEIAVLHRDHAVACRGMRAGHLDARRTRSTGGGRSPVQDHDAAGLRAPGLATAVPACSSTGTPRAWFRP